MSYSYGVSLLLLVESSPRESRPGLAIEGSVSGDTGLAPEVCSWVFLNVPWDLGKSVNHSPIEIECELHM